MSEQCRAVGTVVRNGFETKTSLTIFARVRGGCWWIEAAHNVTVSTDVVRPQEPASMADNEPPAEPPAEEEPEAPPTPSWRPFLVSLAAPEEYGLEPLLAQASGLDRFEVVSFEVAGVTETAAGTPPTTTA